MSNDTDDEPKPPSAAKARGLVEADDIKWLMSSKQGRRIVWRLLDKAGIYRTSFTGNSETFFREGMRNMGLYIVDLITTNCPEAYGLMLTESKASR